MELNPERIEEIRRRAASQYSVPMAGGLHHFDCAASLEDVENMLSHIDALQAKVERLERALSELSEAGSHLASDYAADCDHGGGDHKLCWSMCGKVCSVAEWEHTLGDCGVVLDPPVKQATEDALGGEG